MRPKIYFTIGTFLTFSGLVASVLISVFLIGLIRFSLRTHGPMGKYRLDQIISSFPWWIILIAILGLVVGIWLFRQYDFSYKVNFKLVVVGFIMAIIVMGWIIDMSGLNDTLYQKGPGRGIMKQYFQENNIPPSQRHGKWGNMLK